MARHDRAGARRFDGKERRSVEKASDFAQQVHFDVMIERSAGGSTGRRYHPVGRARPAASLRRTCGSGKAM
jgi:hypothetical protein